MVLFTRKISDVNGYAKVYIEFKIWNLYIEFIYQIYMSNLYIEFIYLNLYI